jgi:hypothetical protein
MRLARAVALALLASGCGDKADTAAGDASFGSGGTSGETGAASGGAPGGGGTAGGGGTLDGGGAAGGGGTAGPSCSADAGKGALVATGTGPGQLEVDDTAIYFVDEHTAIVRVDKSTLGVTTLVSGEVAIFDLAIDSAYVYWTDKSAGKVQRVPKTGGAIEELATGGSPHALATDVDHVYWLDDNDVVRRPKLGGSAAIWATPAGELSGLSVDEANVYASSIDQVFQIPKQGAAPLSWPCPPSQPGGLCGRHLAVDSQRVYFQNEDPTGGLLGLYFGTLFARNKATGDFLPGSDVTLSHPLGNFIVERHVHSVATDGARTYYVGVQTFTAWFDGWVYIASTDWSGAQATLLVQVGPTGLGDGGVYLPIVGDIALDASSVFWSYAGSVYCTPK